MVSDGGPAGRGVRDSRPARPSRRATIAASAGNALEWFDWNAFLVFSVYFAPQFFPTAELGTALLRTFTVFAIGFFFRPLGGLLLGGFADRHGRRRGLILSVLLMAGGSLLIAVCPTYSQAGVLAPVLLLVARIAQGLSTGGEVAAVATYLAEVAPTNRRGLYSSFVYFTSTLGPLAATLLAHLLLGLVGPAGVTAWAWRVPFAIGAVLGFYGLYMRLALTETGPFLAGEDLRVHRPTWQVLRRHPASGLRVAGFTVGATAVYYTFLIYLPGYAHREYGVSSTAALWASVGSQLVLLAALPGLGMLSDRVGRRPLLTVFAASFVVLAVPLFRLLGSSTWTLVGVLCAGLLLFACYAAVAPVAMAELFPTQVRTMGVSLPYSATVALFGGTAPYLSEWLTDRGLASWLPWYLAVLCLVSLIAYRTAPETRGIDLERV